MYLYIGNKNIIKKTEYIENDNYGKFEIEPMEICDGFVLQGGSILESCQINAIKYAIDKKKPILGICLGMQTMAGFNWVNNELGSMATYSEIDNFFKPEAEDNFSYKSAKTED